MGESPQRYAVVSGANKGIGFEIVKQLASCGVKVVLTARDEKRGHEALQTLKASASASGLYDQLVLFHQMDVADPSSVNNAGIGGVVVKDYDLISSALLKGGVLTDDEVEKAVIQTYELAEECLQINYYGAKRTFESLLPLLQLSDSPRIVNVSSFLGKLECVSNEWAKRVLSDADNLTEERVDEVLKEFLKDFKEGSLETKGWPKAFGAYILSKAAMNAYTRIIAKKYPSLCIIAVCSGLVKTDMTGNTGLLTAEEGAASPVRLALLSNGSSSGLFYNRSEPSCF